MDSAVLKGYSVTTGVYRLCKNCTKSSFTCVILASDSRIVIPQLPVNTNVWMPFRRMMSLESSGRVRWAIGAPGWVLEPQYSTVIPP